MGEVDQLHDAVDDGVPDGDQGVQRSQGEPVDELLDKDVHAVDLQPSDFGEAAGIGLMPYPCGLEGRIT